MSRRFRMQVDAQGKVTCFPNRPKSVAERVADHRERHPDRVAAYNAQRRAQRHAAKTRYAELCALARQQAAAVVPAAPLALRAPPVRLCLPAPAEQLPLFIRDERTPEPVPTEAEQREESRGHRAA